MIDDCLPVSILRLIIEHKCNKTKADCSKDKSMSEIDENDECSNQYFDYS